MSDQGGGNVSRKDILRMACRVSAAYMSQNPLKSNQISSLVKTVHESLSAIAHGGEASGKPNRKPAVSVARSVAPNYIVCLEDGRRMKMLKRHLKAAYGLSPEEYRQRWNLPADYPMVAPKYAEQRSDFAKKMGLGKSRSNKP